MCELYDFTNYQQYSVKSSSDAVNSIKTLERVEMSEVVLGEVTLEEVVYYRKKYKKKELTIKQIAIAKNMSYSGVYAFIRGKSWRMTSGAPSIFNK